MTIEKSRFRPSLKISEEERQEISRRIWEVGQLPRHQRMELALEAFKIFEPIAKEYTICFSGGKDSIVILDLAKKANVKFKAVYNRTTIDSPELIYSIKKNYPEVEFGPIVPFMLSRMIKEPVWPPTRKNRWCCRLYKECYTDGFKVIGVRAEESIRRKYGWNIYNRSTEMGHILCPIVYWTEQNVWNYIHDNDLKYPPGYDDRIVNGVLIPGQKRMGCIGCPMSPSSRLIEFKKYPKFARLWHKFIVMSYNKWSKIYPEKYEYWKDGNDMFKWWMEGDAEELEECIGMFV